MKGRTGGACSELPAQIFAEFRVCEASRLPLRLTSSRHVVWVLVWSDLGDALLDMSVTGVSSDI